MRWRFDIYSPLKKLTGAPNAFYSNAGGWACNTGKIQRRVLSKLHQLDLNLDTADFSDTQAIARITSIEALAGIRITEEQELHVIRRQLQQFPEAVQAIIQAAHALQKPVVNLSGYDVEAWASRDKVA